MLRAPPPARRLAAQAASCAPSRSSCPATRCTPSSSRAPASRRSPPRWRWSGCSSDLMKDPEIGQRIVPIAPDEYRTFGMDSMFPTAKVYNPARPAATSRSTASCCWPTRSPRRARCSTRASPRRARWRPRRPPGSAYSTHGEHDDPVLHLLLDVRLPAHRRLDLGDGRPAGPRLPDRRHRRPHHADRRGPAARRRALAAARRDQPGGRALRPGVRLRDQPHRAGRPARGCTARPRSTRTARTSSTTSPSTTSRSSQPKRAGGPRRRGPAQGHLPRRRTARAGRPTTRRGCSCSPPASGFPWITEAQRLLAEDWGVAADTWSVTSWNELARDARRAPRSGTSCTPPSEPRTPYVTDKLHGRRGPGRGGQRLHARRAAADRALGARRLPRARRRRVRLRRHPAGRPPLLPHRRRSRSSCQALAGPGRRAARSSRETVAGGASTTYRIDDPTAVAGVKQEGGDA